MITEKNQQDEKVEFTLTISSAYSQKKLEDLIRIGMLVIKDEENQKVLTFTGPDPLTFFKTSRDHKCSKNEVVSSLVIDGFQDRNLQQYKVFHIYNNTQYYMVLDKNSLSAGIMELGDCAANRAKLLASNSLKIADNSSLIEQNNSSELVVKNSPLLDKCTTLYVTSQKCPVSYYPFYDLSKNNILNIDDLASSCEGNELAVYQNISFAHNETLHNITSDKDSSVSEEQTGPWKKFFIFSSLAFGASLLTLAVNNTFGRDDDDNHGGGGNKEFSKQTFYPPINPLKFRQVKIDNLTKFGFYTNRKFIPWMKNTPEYCEQLMHNKNPDIHKDYCSLVASDLQKVLEQNITSFEPYHHFHHMAGVHPDFPHIC